MQYLQNLIYFMIKQMQIGLLSLVLLSVLQVIGSCRKTRCCDPKNPECENYDPCFGRHIENEILISRAGYGGITNWFQPDVKFSKDNIYFLSNPTTASLFSGSRI
jgi:hypothetical protein